MDAILYTIIRAIVYGVIGGGVSVLFLYVLDELGLL